MKYKIIHYPTISGKIAVSVIIDQGLDHFVSFPAEVDNPVYDSFLKSQALTDIQVQETEPDVWHDITL